MPNYVTYFAKIRRFYFVIYCHFKVTGYNFTQLKLNEGMLAVVTEILNVLELIIGNIDFNEVIDKLMADGEMLDFLNKMSEHENVNY